MAEAVGLAASIIAVIQISESVISGCRRYISAVKDAEKDLRRILVEVAALKAVLEHLDTIAESADETTGVTTVLRGQDGTLESCRRCLQELDGFFPRLEAFDTSEQSSKRRKTLANRLAWPFRRDKANKLLDEIARHKSTVQLIVATGSCSDVKEIKKSVLKIENTLSQQERREFFRWLQNGPNDTSSIHNKWLDTREERTSTWILEYWQWKNWLSSDSNTHRLLWINGIPGAGKTLLMSFVIDTLEKYCEAREGFAVAYYYCHYTHSRDEGEPFLRCVLAQLCRRLQSIPSTLYDAFCDDTAVGLPTLLDALEECLAVLDTAFVALDAVDESLPRPQLLRILKAVSTEARFVKLRIVASSRCLVDIERVLQPISRQLSMTEQTNSTDIRVFIDSALRKPTFSWWSLGLKAKVASVLAVRSSGMFRWTACQLDLLGRMTSESQVSKGLTELPETLRDAYQRIMLSLSEQQRIVVLNTLVWIHCRSGVEPHELEYTSRVPILTAATRDADKISLDSETVRTLCGCLVQLDKNSSEPLLRVPIFTAATRDTGRISLDSETVRTLCECLVQLDKNSSEPLRLAHRSVFEFLLSCITPNVPSEDHLIHAFMRAVFTAAASYYASMQTGHDGFGRFIHMVVLSIIQLRGKSIMKRRATLSSYVGYLYARARYWLPELLQTTEKALWDDGAAATRLINVQMFLFLCHHKQLSIIIKYRKRLGAASFMNPGLLLSQRQVATILKGVALEEGEKYDEDKSAGKMAVIDLALRPLPRIPRYGRQGMFCILACHNHRQTCGTSCIVEKYIVDKTGGPMDLPFFWEAYAKAAIACLDYHGLEILLRYRPSNPSRYHEEAPVSAIVDVLKGLKWYPVKSGQMHHFAIAMLFDFYCLLSQVAVFDAEERVVWAAIKELLSRNSINAASDAAQRAEELDYEFNNKTRFARARRETDTESETDTETEPETEEVTGKNITEKTEEKSGLDDDDETEHRHYLDRPIVEHDNVFF